MKRVLTSFRSNSLHPAGADPWVWDSSQQVLATQGAVSRGANVYSGAAGCSIDERESLRPFGTTWNLFASGAMECRPVSWDAVACIRFSRRNMDR